MKGNKHKNRAVLDWDLESFDEIKRGFVSFMHEIGRGNEVKHLATTCPSPFQCKGACRKHFGRVVNAQAVPN